MIKDTIDCNKRAYWKSIVSSQEEVSNIIDKYINQNYSLKKLCNEYGVCPQTMRNLLRKNKIQLRGNKQGYPRNENYFNEIDTPDKAYWLGLLMADGCINEKTNEVRLSLIDKEHIEKFQQALGIVNHKIGCTIDKRFESGNKYQYYIAVKDKKIVSDLKKWGCVQNKTYLLNDIPNIPRKMISHFIRGYFDGDGSLHYLQGTNNWRISFVSYQSDFLSQIKKELEVDMDIQKDNNLNRLQINGRKQVERVLNYIYQDSNNNIRLARKYQKYLECLQWAHRH